MNKHTKEPWKYIKNQDVFDIITEDDSGFQYIGEIIEESDVKRVVTEHNTLAGIEDIAGWFEVMKLNIESALTLSTHPDAIDCLEQALDLFPKESEKEDE